MITHGAWTIAKIAVYDIATNFMIYLMVYSVNYGKFYTRGCLSVISSMTAQNWKFSIFSGIVLPVFNEATGKDMFSISLLFLSCSEILLFMIFFYNILCAAFEASVQCTYVLELFVYPLVEHLPHTRN